MVESFSLRTALDKAYRPLEGDFLTTVLVELAPPLRTQRLPVNLGLLIDTSESMAHDKLAYAKETVLALIDQLGADDIVALIAFGSAATVLLPAHRRGDELRDLAKQALDHLRAEGVTSLLRGLEQAFSEVRRHAGPERTSFVILLSDGYPTTLQGYVDQDTVPYVQRADREMRSAGISLTVIGLGDAEKYDPVFLRALADAGNGQFLYCSSPAALAEQFQAEFQRIRRTVFADVTLTVRHLAGEVRRLWRVFPDKKLFEAPAVRERSFSVPLGSFQDGQPQAFLIDLVTAAQPGRPPGRERLLEVEAAWYSQGERQTSSRPVVLEYTDQARALAQRNPEVVRLATEAMDALLENELESAVASGDAGRLTSVLSHKKQLTIRLGKADATRVLEEMESALARGETISQDALARSSQATRPTQRLG